MKVCIVTEELVGLPNSGGIGTAFSELAGLLAANGAEVEVVICRAIDWSSETRANIVTRSEADGFKATFLDTKSYAWGPHDAAKRAFAVYQYLKTKEFDVIHFADYLANGYYSMLAKTQGLAFKKTLLVTQIHGPSRWAMLENNKMPQSFEDMKIDFMEREQIRLSDQVVAPSHYILRRAAELGFRFPAETKVIKNCFGQLAKVTKTRRLAKGDIPTPITEVIFFGRHEDRKGVSLFCDVVDSLAQTLVERNVTVTFLGGLGVVRGQPSGVFLLERAQKWKMNIKVLANLDRDQAARYMARRAGALVLMPSIENSPYTVVETIATGLSFITSSDGGAHELIAEVDRSLFTTELTTAAISQKARQFIEGGTRAASFDQSAGSVADDWLSFHAEAATNLRKLRRAFDRRVARKDKLPKVVLGITHFERPAKLLDAIWSAVRQTYQNLEIVVVDDGSRSTHSIESLSLVEKTLERVGGRLIRQENKYLGAARNAIAAHSQSDYIVFLDDDNLAKPGMVQTLVSAALSSDADVITCMSHFMPENQRAGTVSQLDTYHDPLSYCPTGGPISAGLFENCFGDATALIRRETFDDIGGYTELFGVGYEDYEFFLRCMQAGKMVTVCPEQLYVYEIGKTGMLAGGSPWRNQRRILDAASRFTLNPEAVREVLELVAGRTVAEHEQGRNRWIFESKYGSVGYDTLLDANVPVQTRLIKLAELAEIAESPKCADAFRRAARNEGLDEPQPQTPIQSKVLVIPAAVVEIASSVDALWQCNLQAYSKFLSGDAEEAANLVLSQMLEASQVDSAVVSLLIRILRYSDFIPSPKFVDSLFACVNQVGDDASIVPLLWSALVLCSKKADNYQALGALWAHIVSEESKQYCRTYPDVGSAIENKLYPSAIHHFSNHGSRERRVGFSVAASLQDELAKYFGCPSNLLDVTAATQQRFRP